MGKKANKKLILKLSFEDEAMKQMEQLMEQTGCKSFGELFQNMFGCYNVLWNHCFSNRTIDFSGFDNKTYTLHLVDKNHKGVE